MSNVQVERSNIHSFNYLSHTMKSDFKQLLDKAFIRAIDLIIEKNNSLKIKPANYSAMGLLINPTNRNIIYDIQAGRKHASCKLLIALAAHFKVDMNFFFYEGFHLNYVPHFLNNDQNTAASVVYSNMDINTNNQLQFNTLVLAADLYKRVETFVKSIQPEKKPEDIQG